MVIKYKYESVRPACWGKDSSIWTVRKSHHALRQSQTEKTLHVTKTLTQGPFLQRGFGRRVSK